MTSRINLNALADERALNAGEMRATTGGHRYTWLVVGVGPLRYCRQVTYWPWGHSHPRKPSYCP